MEIKEVIRLDMLDENSVSVLKQRFIDFDGFYQKIGGNIRNAYVNSAEGRKLVAAALPLEYYNAVIAVWGNEPTVFDSEETEETELP